MDFKSYVSRIIWEADHDGEAFPPDACHVWCVEGSGSCAGSLSSLGSATSQQDDEEGNDRLSCWGPKFQALSEMYDRPQLGLRYRDAMAYVERSHEPLAHQH